MNVSSFKRNSLRFKKKIKKKKRKERPSEAVVFLKQNKTRKNEKLNAVQGNNGQEKAVLSTERFGFRVCFQSRGKGYSRSTFAHNAGLHLLRRKQWLIHLSVILFHTILSYDLFPFPAPDET